MAHPPTRPESPTILTRHLKQLNQQLRELTNQLKHDIAVTVGETEASAVKSFLRRLLDVRESTHPFHPVRDTNPTHEMPFRDSEFPMQAWSRDSDAWPNDVEEEPFETPPPAPPSFLKKALTTGVQAGLWWLRQQPRRRPILSTLLVAALAAGGTLLAGPTLGAGLAVMGSLAGLIISGSAVHGLGEQLLNLFRF